MIERHHEELVGGVQQIEQEPFDGCPRVDDPLAEHAVARVEQHAEADGDPFVGELRDGLAFAVLVHLERLAWKAGDGTTLAIDHRRRDGDDVDTGLPHAIAARDLVGLRPAFARQNLRDLRRGKLKGSARQQRECER